MARRAGGPLFDVFVIASKLPWWVGLLLAVITYIFLHSLSLMEIPSVTRAQPFPPVGKVLAKTFAYYGQFVIPVVLLLASGTSAWKRLKGQMLYKDAARGASFRNMTWQEFERLVGEAFRARGYSCTATGGTGPDGGIDLTLTKGGEKFLVQCKQWRALKVGVDVVRELYGVMVAHGATGGFVVTSGTFTEDARKFVDGLNIELWDGEQLTRSIRSTPAISPVTKRVLPLRTRM